MSIKFNTSCQLIDNKYVVVANGIEYTGMIYWLLEYFEFTFYQ